MPGGVGSCRRRISCRGLTVNVLWTIEIDAQDAAIGEGENDDVVGHLRGDKLGGNGELKLDSLDGEDGQVVVVGPIGGDEAVMEVE